MDHRFCIAPMMNRSDRHCRYFWRLLSKNALLYTEMVTTGALLHGDRARFLNFNRAEHPLALQLGGSNPRELARCSQWAQEWGYDEVNLNCGCPSGRVQAGSFGACLMGQPQLVRDCLAAMTDAASIPISVKHRTGIDDMDSYQQMLDFVAIAAESGVSTFIIHARKAWLQGLSPRENRQVPPLHYHWIYRLKRDRPELEIVINGGLDSLTACREHLQNTDGVMMGRAAYHNPYMLAEVDSFLFEDHAAPPDRAGILSELVPYIEEQMEQGASLHHITRHIPGLFQEVPGARKFRRHLSENAGRTGAKIDVLRNALELVVNETRRAAQKTERQPVWAAN